MRHNGVVWIALGNAGSKRATQIAAMPHNTKEERNAVGKVIENFLASLLRQGAIYPETLAKLNIDLPPESKPHR
jgi:hypothetical protein